MDQVVLLFSGQGAQAPGMGQAWMAQGGAAAQVFERTEGLRPGTQAQCFTGDKETLSLTENTQPCLFCVDLATAVAVREAGVQPMAVAGFSLGEIPALAFSGMLSMEDAFALVMLRAEAMGQAAKAHPGGMAAVLGLEDAAVEVSCAQYGVYPVNYNCPRQLVIAGEKAALDQAAEALKAQKARVMPLNVSGAFHSPLMAGAQEALAGFLAGHPLQAPRMPVYANATGLPYASPYAETLVRQVASPVRWRETLENLWAAGGRVFIEVGIGKTLCGLVKKTLPEAQALAVSDPESLAAALETLKGGATC